MNTIRVMIVDDSRVFRSIVESILKDIVGVKVVASLWNGQKALEYLQENEVDLITLDIEMPLLDGLETLREIEALAQKKRTTIGTIMLSAKTVVGAEATMAALNLGAFDFISKPDIDAGEAGFTQLKNELEDKIAAWQKRGTAISHKQIAVVKRSAPITSKIPKSDSPIILIGVSTGGPKALNRMLPELTKVTSAPILIVQHMPPGFTQSLAKGLDQKCSHTVIEGSEGAFIEDKHVYIAPGGSHMILRKENGKAVISVNQNPPENRCRPSVDVLFRSAAQFKTHTLIALILTGMGNDGTAGIRSLKRAGAHIIVQDEESSVVWGMPGSAFATGLVDNVLSLMDMPSEITKHL